MEVDKYSFSADIANLVAVAHEDIFKIDESTGNTTSTRMHRKGERIGLLTGYIIQYKNFAGEYVEIYNSNKNAVSYVDIRMINYEEQNTSLKVDIGITAQSELDKLIATNMEIMDNLLAASGIAMAAERNGVNVSAYRQRIKILYQNLEYRNNELAESGFLETKEKGATPLYDFSADLVKVLKDKPAIGLEPATTILIVKASIALIFAVVAYVTIKTLLTGGKSDLSEARKLVTEIARLEPEQAKVANDILGKYYSGSGIGTIVKYGVIAAAAFLGFNYLLPKIKS